MTKFLSIAEMITCSGTCRCLASHSLGVNWPHFYTGQATREQELKVKCWGSLMTLARVSWWQQEDFHLNDLLWDQLKGKLAINFFWWQPWYEILLKFFFFSLAPLIHWWAIPTQHSCMPAAALQDTRQPSQL